MTNLHQDKVSIKAAIVEIVRRDLEWEGDVPDGDLSNYLDSIKRMSLVIAIEDHWEMCLEPEDEEVIKTLDDLVNVVYQIVQKQAVTKEAS